jgi:hypothetical protein
VRLLAWTVLVLVTIAWTVVGAVHALAMWGIGGDHALGTAEFWVYALSPVLLIALTTRIGIALAKQKPEAS